SVGTLNDTDSQVLAFSYGTANEMRGLLDEIRVYSGIQTDDWIKTEFNTQNDPTQNATCTDSGFICVGSEETDPPTAVSLISFSATGDTNDVRVEWETGHEIRNLGFNLYRSTSAAGPFIQLNDHIIPGLEYSVKGKSYAYTDSTVIPGTLYYYQLEDIDASGIRTFHGPVCVDWDADGMPDDWEIFYGLNPWVNDADLDVDKDGLTHLEEYESGFDPLNPDSDGDGILDGQEGYKIEREASNGSRGLMRGVQILASDNTGVTIELHTETFDTEIVTADGQEFERLRISDYIHGYTQELGQPELPVKGIFLDLPEGQSATLSVLQTEINTYDGYQVFPVPENILDDQGTISAVAESFVWDQSAYANDAFYPAAVAGLGDGFVFRDQIKQQVLFYPLTFNPASGQLRHHRKIQVRIDYVDCGNCLAKADSFRPAPWQLPTTDGTSDSVPPVGQMAMAFGAAPIMVNPISPVLSSLGVLVNALWSPDMGAQGTAYKIQVEEEGIYRLTRDYLASNGVDVDALDLSQIRIYNLGSEIAIYLYDENGDDVIDSSDYIEFYGQPVAAPYAKYGRPNVYWLVTEGGLGTPRRMLEIDGTPAAGALAATHTYTVHHEEDEYYHGRAPGDDSLDRWFFDDLVLGSALTGTPDPVPIDFTIHLPGVTGPGSLTISMWGYFDAYHDLEIQVNGVTANIANWSGIAFHEVTLDGIDLLEGDNIITLICNRDMDAVIVDWFEITYARMFQASNNALKFSHDSGYRYQISDFDAGNLVAFDITQATDPARVVNVEISGTNPYNFEFEPPVNPGATETYLVLTSNSSKVPVGLIEDTAADLALTANGADYILITHRDLGWDGNGDAYGWLEDLVALREGQGLRVKVVDVQDIFDEFSYGMTSAAAIRDFIAYAYNNWEPPAPQYVLLVGDSSYDFKDNLQLGITNYVPTYLTFTEFMGETLTDEWFVKISGNDAVPDLYIGRLPAETEADATSMVNKILAYEAAPITKTWEKNVVLIADNQTEAYEVYFETMNDNAESLLPGSMSDPFKGYLGDYLSPANLTNDIKAQINAGALIVNYSGHGSFQRWAGEGIFQNSDVADLTNAGKYPFVVNMSCLTGYFGFLSKTTGPEPSLAEALLKADSKGAIAALMPTAMTEPEGQHILDTALFEAIFSKEIRRLGPAISDAKQTLLANGGTAVEEISETFLLFGDPALTLKIPVPYKPTEVEIQLTAEGIKLSWQAAEDSSGNPVAGYNVYRSSTPAGNYIKINTELITETEFLDTDAGGVSASSAGGSGGGAFYYGVTSVDDSGDESAQTLGSSPPAIGSTSSEMVACFIGTTNESIPKHAFWLFIGLTIFISILIRFQVSRVRKQKTADNQSYQVCRS
ncbi:MAG: C25 family cysteine peptidase, partial [Desulfobacterales bacterium]